MPKTFQQRLEEVQNRTGREIEVNPNFICPISLEIMDDPVTISGINFDRNYLLKWFGDYTIQSHPITRRSIHITEVQTTSRNRVIYNLIEEYILSLEQEAGIDYFQELNQELQEELRQAETRSSIMNYVLQNLGLNNQGLTTSAQSVQAPEPAIAVQAPATIQGPNRFIVNPVPPIRNEINVNVEQNAPSFMEVYQQMLEMLRDTQENESSTTLTICCIGVIHIIYSSIILELLGMLGSVGANLLMAAPACLAAVVLNALGSKQFEASQIFNALITGSAEIGILLFPAAITLALVATPFFMAVKKLFHHESQLYLIDNPVNLAGLEYRFIKIRSLMHLILLNADSFAAIFLTGNFNLYRENYLVEYHPTTTPFFFDLFLLTTAAALMGAWDPFGFRTASVAERDSMTILEHALPSVMAVAALFYLFNCLMRPSDEEEVNQVQLNYNHNFWNQNRNQVRNNRNNRETFLEGPDENIEANNANTMNRR